MARFKGATLTCKTCGSGFRVPPSRASTAEFCSIKCASVGRGERQRKRVTLICDGCHAPFEAHECQADRRKYCSYKCKHTSLEYRAMMSHLTSGEANGMWNGGQTDHSDGYIYHRAPHHPFASNGYVLGHRLAMEEWLRENAPDSRFLMKVGNQLYLAPQFHVHHKDKDKRNNDIANLECLTPSEHQRHHNDLRRLSSS